MSERAVLAPLPNQETTLLSTATSLIARRASESESISSELVGGSPIAKEVLGLYGAK